jgi:predicted dehydrogenase
MQSGSGVTRRRFLDSAAVAAAAAILPRPAIAGSGQTPPSERCRLAFVGVGGRGARNLQALANLEQHVVALCDVDRERAAASFARFPRARHYRDFRRMLDEVENEIDGVVISTPDHTHASVAMAAMERGKHVYCEKPLAHTIGEVRALQRAARDHRVVTQLGNQGHSFDHIRLFCEWIWDGAIGNIHTVHAQRPSDYSRIDALDSLRQRPPVPDTLDWDLWLGPVAQRPYHPAYLPGKWRGWTPFGTGVLGDWTCHIVDPVFWALDLGWPETVKATTEGYDSQAHADTFPRGTKVTYHFAAREPRGPVTLHWYDGSLAPPVLPEVPWHEFPRNTSAVVLGDRGAIRYGSHGATGLRIFPEERMRAYRRPEPTLPRVAGHYQDWLDAIRRGGQAGSDFDYGGALTEIALLGVIATRLSGTSLAWDGSLMRFTNCDEANGMLDSPRRAGWELDGRQ